MAQLLILILDDLDYMPEILKAWDQIGIPGATILSSVGAHRAKGWLQRMGLGALENLFEASEIRRKTLITAIEDDLVDQAVAEAERVVGGFSQPNTGLLVVLPVSIARGLQKISAAQSKKDTLPAMHPSWNPLRDMSIAEADIILNLKPTLIKPETTLDQVAKAMLACPEVHVACVVNENEQLVGLIKLRALADDLFFHILPEEFISEVTDLQHAMEFASISRIRTAADAMEEAVWVKRDDTVKDAFKRLHENDLPGLPVVDNTYHVIGYINLLELVALCMQGIDKNNENKEAK
jgi:CBS domain-containing protein